MLGRDVCVTKSVFTVVPVVLATLLWTGAGAQADGFCTPPVPPPPLDGAAATAQQLRDAVDKARDFIGLANLYENCLRQQLQEIQASGGDPAAGQAEKVGIAANRHLRDRVSSETATAMTAYKKAHAN